jgi:hypothetical protein
VKFCGHVYRGRAEQNARLFADARAMTCPHLRLPLPFADLDGIDEPDEDYLL